MTDLDDLAAVAAVGTARRTSLPPLPHITDAVPTRSGDLAVAALDAAAALTVVSRGAIGTTAESLTACSPETQSEPPAEFMSALRQVTGTTGGGVIGDYQTRVAVACEALGWMHDRDVRLPHREIVPLLQHPQAQVRRAARLVSGQRGRWLTALPGAPGDPPAPTPSIEEWTHGTSAQQLNYLTNLRAVDPQQAMELVAQQWKQSPAALRAEITTLIADNPQPTDEDFLENCLSDRAASVRSAAPPGLEKLPNSGYVGRMMDRIPALIQADVKGRVIVTPPAPDEHDQLGKKLTAQDRVTRVVAAIPPAGWKRATGLTATELLAAPGPARSQKDPGYQLIPGLVHSAASHTDTDLAVALLEAGHIDARLSPYIPAAVMAGALAKAGHKALAKAGEWVRLLTEHPRPWPEEVSLAVTRTITSAPKLDAIQAAVWAALAVAASPNTAAQCAEGVSARLARESQPKHGRMIAAATATLTLRATLWRTLMTCQPAAHREET